jgi:uncharacterized RDD family membrane protein YckC
LILPAPLWRRLIAALYDGLLLLGLWMAAALADVLVRDQLLGYERQPQLQYAYFFAVGLGFFGWFWTHGGQTLGMRVWKLRLRTEAGDGLNWPRAAGRYAATLLCWAVVLTPLAARLPPVARQHPQAGMVAAAAAVAVLAALILQRLDGRRRAPQDWLSGTEMVFEPAER